MQDVPEQAQGPSPEAGGLRESNSDTTSPAGGQRADQSLRSEDGRADGKLTGDDPRRTEHMEMNDRALCLHRRPFSWGQKVHSELEGLKKDLGSIAEKSEEVLASPQQSSSAPLLHSELDVTLKKMDHVYGLSSVYLDK